MEKENSRYVPEASLRNITTRWKGLRWAMPSKVFIAHTTFKLHAEGEVRLRELTDLMVGLVGSQWESTRESPVEGRAIQKAWEGGGGGGKGEGGE